MEIWEKDRRYSFLRKYVDACTRRSYCRFKVRGLQNIPKDGAVIIAPNHCNTLMDPLVVMSTRPDPMSFGARADVFNNPFVAKIMHFLKIVPMVRARDGIRNVEKNRETMEEIFSIIDNNVAFCMFPEGTHRPKHSLLPIKKGIARIALTADDRMGDRKKVYIVPCGIEYGDYFHFRSTCRVAYGKPIDIQEVKANNSNLNEAELHALVQEKVKEGISHLITYLEDDENYDKRWARIQRRRQIRPRFWWFINVTVLFPVFLVSTILAAPELIAAACILKNTKDRAFHNTVRYATKLLIAPLAVILWTVLAAVIFKSWWITLVVALFASLSQNMFYDYTNFVRTWREVVNSRKTCGADEK